MKFGGINTVFSQPKSAMVLLYDEIGLGFELSKLRSHLQVYAFLDVAESTKTLHSTIPIISVPERSEGIAKQEHNEGHEKIPVKLRDKMTEKDPTMAESTELTQYEKQQNQKPTRNQLEPT